MATDAENLRLLLGERIPNGGDDSDTLFSDAEIDEFLLEADNSLNLAAYSGWVAKAAEFANLTTKSEGNALEQFSDLLKNALKMVELYAGLAGVDISGGARRTRIHQITRPSRSGGRWPEL